MIRRGRIHMTLAEFDATPAGWADELYLQEAGWDAAAVVVEKKQRRNPPPDESGRPVYGMPGTRVGPGRGAR